MNGFKAGIKGNIIVDMPKHKVWILNVDVLKIEMFDSETSVLR